MSSSADVVLDPSITLPDGRPVDGRFVAWGFAIFVHRYRIEADGRLIEEDVDLDGVAHGEPRRVPLHGLFTFESQDGGRTRYTARFTYGALDGIKVGEADAWDEEHGA